MAKRMDFTNLNRGIDKSCLEIENCGECDGRSCIVKYSKDVMDIYSSKRLRMIPKGLEKIPSLDMKVYDQNDVTDVVAESLLLCKECKDNHTGDCTINIIRAAFERILIGDNLDDYRGSVLQHIMELTKVNPEIGQGIMQKYTEIKSR